MGKVQENSPGEGRSGTMCNRGCGLRRQGLETMVMGTE